MDARHDGTPQGDWSEAVEIPGDNFHDSLDEWAEIDWSALPRGLQDIKAHVGLGAALVLAEEYGGGAVYVPSRVRDGQVLARLIGPEKARRLSDAYGGDKLHVPKVDAIERQFRTRRIVTLRKAGRTVASLAREFNLTCRRVRQICSA